MGGVLAELHTGYVLFQNDSLATMLARIAGIVGPYPQEMLAAGKETQKYFTLSNIVYDRAPEGQGGSSGRGGAGGEDDDDDDEDEAGGGGGFVLIYPKKTSLEARLHMLPSQRYYLNAASSLSSPLSLRETSATAPPPASQVSDEEADLFVDFVRQLLCIDPNKRPTASQALAHPWLAGADDFDLAALNEAEGRWGAGATAPNQEGDIGVDGEEDYDDEDDDDDDGDEEGEEEEEEEDTSTGANEEEEKSKA